MGTIGKRLYSIISTSANLCNHLMGQVLSICGLKTTSEVEPSNTVLYWYVLSCRNQPNFLCTDMHYTHTTQTHISCKAKNITKPLVIHTQCSTILRCSEPANLKRTSYLQEAVPCPCGLFTQLSPVQLTQQLYWLVGSLCVKVKEEDMDPIR